MRRPCSTADLDTRLTSQRFGCPKVGHRAAPGAGPTSRTRQRELNCAAESPNPESRLQSSAVVCRGQGGGQGANCARKSRAEARCSLAQIRRNRYVSRLRHEHRLLQSGGLRRRVLSCTEVEVDRNRHDELHPALNERSLMAPLLLHRQTVSRQQVPQAQELDHPLARRQRKARVRGG